MTTHERKNSFLPGSSRVASRLSIKRSSLLRYGLAVLAVALALLVKLLLEPVIVQETPFLLVFAAIMISIWYGGLGPGLAATVFAVLVADYFFLPPFYAFSGFSLEAVPWGMFVLEGTLISVLVTCVVLCPIQGRGEHARGPKPSGRPAPERGALSLAGGGCFLNRKF